MSISEDYRKIFEAEIDSEVRKNIKIYDKDIDIHLFQPLSHNCEQICNNSCTHKCYKTLGSIMRKNIVFYSYGESEIVDNYNNGMFSDLNKAVAYAYRQRLPKRKPKQDGLPSEVLFDLIIQTLLPNAYKLAVRTIMRQNDNNEIKGYDLTYFTKENGQTTLWLGQAKLGSKQYCKDGIKDDLDTKYNASYLSNQIYFLADKPCGLTDEAKEITQLINKLNMINALEDESKRAIELLKCFLDNGIQINIPCLLAYDKNSVYKDINNLQKEIEKETKWAKNNFNKIFNFQSITPKLLFFIFPLEDIEKLRGDDGFYAGLH